MATIGAFVDVFFHDTQHLLEVGAQIVFFLTPIMYTRKLLDDKQTRVDGGRQPGVLFLELIRDAAPDRAPCRRLRDVPGRRRRVTVALVGLAVGTVAWLQKRVIFHL